MARQGALKSFYASQKWQDFRILIINERGLNCEHCKERVIKSADLTLHHIVELTEENVHDAMIALNPEKILVVHHACHNKLHDRFGNQKARVPRGVYLVYGPPLAGKKTFVRDQMTRGDIVVDMDMLYAAVTMLPQYDKPNGLLSNVMAVHRTLIDNIKTRYGKWGSAWIIGGYADRYKREQLANEVGAELVFCDVSQEECLRRLEDDEPRRHSVAEWRKYIDVWFETYTV